MILLIANTLFLGFEVDDSRAAAMGGHWLLIRVGTEVSERNGLAVKHVLTTGHDPATDCQHPPDSIYKASLVRDLSLRISRLGLSFEALCRLGALLRPGLYRRMAPSHASAEAIFGPQHVGLARWGFFADNWNVFDYTLVLMGFNDCTPPCGCSFRGVSEA